MRKILVFVVVCLVSSWAFAEMDQSGESHSSSQARPQHSDNPTHTSQQTVVDGGLSHPLSTSDWRSLDSRTLEELYHLPTYFERAGALYIFLQGADEEKLKIHLREVEKFDPERRRGGPFDVFVARYADLNPQATFEYLDSQGDYFVYKYSSVLFHVWARNDLEEAVRFAESLPFPLRQSAARTIV